MSDTALSRGELVVRTIAQTAVDNETYFCELDAVVGDGDFGYSLARGFEIVVSSTGTAMEYADVGGLLKKTAIVLTKRIGGTSGPIWGTAFLRAGGALADKPQPDRRGGHRRLPRRDRGDQAARQHRPGRQDAARRAGARRRRARGGAAQRGAPHGASRRRPYRRAQSAEATKGMLAQRGRASYTGERSRDSVDAGAVGIAVMFEAVSKAWQEAELELA